MIGVALEVSQHLAVAGVIGVVFRHGVVAVLAHRLAGNDVGGFTNAAVAFLGTENPVTPYLVVLLVADNITQALIQKILDRRNAGAAGSDDGDAGISTKIHGSKIRQRATKEIGGMANKPHLDIENTNPCHPRPTYSAQHY